MPFRKPLAIDLYAGLGGWAEGFLSEGYSVVGFDNAHTAPYAAGLRYPGQLVLQDVLTLHGSQFRDAAVIVASPPCQNYSYLAMPWSLSKSEHSQKAKALRRKWETEGPDNRLFDACFRIQREAIQARVKRCFLCNPVNKRFARFSGQPCPRCYIPLIVENVRGAQPWVGRAAWNYGSYYLWGDVPALMPFGTGRKVTGRNFHVHGLTNGAVSSPSFNGAEHETRGVGLGVKIGGDWFSDPNSTCQKHGSRSNARKLASAMIAKIPFELANHIAQIYKPGLARTAKKVQNEGLY